MNFASFLFNYMAQKKKKNDCKAPNSQELAFTGTMTTFLSNFLNFCLSAAGHADLALTAFHVRDVMSS